MQWNFLHLETSLLEEVLVGVIFLIKKQVISKLFPQLARASFARAQQENKIN